jgi:hypothetical protein
MPSAARFVCSLDTCWLANPIPPSVPRVVHSSPYLPDPSRDSSDRTWHEALFWALLLPFVAFCAALVSVLLKKMYDRHRADKSTKAAHPMRWALLSSLLAFSAGLFLLLGKIMQGICHIAATAGSARRSAKSGTYLPPRPPWSHAFYFRPMSRPLGLPRERECTVAGSVVLHRPEGKRLIYPELLRPKAPAIPERELTLDNFLIDSDEDDLPDSGQEPVSEP